MTFIRPLSALIAVVGILLVPLDWREIPDLYPPLANWVPNWVFTTPGILAVCFMVLYVSSETNNIRRSLSFRWLKPVDATRYFRHHLVGADDSWLVITLDQTSDETEFQNLAAVYLISGVNDGKISLRGRLENGVATMPVPVPLEPHAYSRVQNRPPYEAQVGADGCIYVDLEFLRSDIRKFAKYQKKLSTEQT